MPRIPPVRGSPVLNSEPLAVAPGIGPGALLHPELGDQSMHWKFDRLARIEHIVERTLMATEYFRRSIRDTPKDSAARADSPAGW